MILIKKIHDVSSICLSGINSYSYTIGSVLYLDEFSIDLREEKHGEIRLNYENKIFIFSDGDTYFLSNKKPVKLKYNVLSVVNDFTLKVYVYDYEKIEMIYNIYDYEKDILKIDWSNKDCIQIEDFIFQFIPEFKIISSNYHWTFDFLYPKYLDLQERLVSPKIEKFIGIYEQQLWILFSNNRFVVLDVESGKELFQIEDLKTTLNVEGLKVGEVFMDHAREKLLILAFKYYIEIDLKTRKCSIVKILEQDGWYIGKGSFYEGDNYIYFCGRRSNLNFHSIGNTSAGIFNTDTYEIDWHFTLEREEKNYFFVDVPQANNKYFGVKDCEKTLFLFER